MDEEETVEVAPRRAKGKTVSPAQRLMTKSYERARTVSDYHDEDTQESGIPVQIQHNAPSKVRVYKLTPSGCTSIMVNVQSLGGPEGVLNHPNYSAVCFDCGRDDCGPGINDCTGRPKRQFRICPVATCGKHVYDPMPTGAYQTDDGMARPGGEEDDEGLIDDDAYAAVNPAVRTKVALDRHIIGYHEQEAITFGLRAPTLRDMQTPVAV